MANDLKLEFFLSATPGTVMQLLTDPALIRKWSGEDAVLETRTGGAFSMFGGWATGTVLRADDKELAITWLTTDWPEGTKPTEVVFSLSGTNGGTRVSLVQTGFPTEEAMKDHREGWTDFFFDPLEDYIMIFENRD